MGTEVPLHPLTSHCVGPGLSGAVPLPRWAEATYLVGQGLQSAPWPTLPIPSPERGGCSVTRGPCPLPLPSLCLWGTPRVSTWPRQSRTPPDKVECKERWPDWPWPQRRALPHLITRPHLQARPRTGGSLHPPLAKVACPKFPQTLR